MIAEPPTEEKVSAASPGRNERNIDPELNQRAESHSEPSAYVLRPANQAGKRQGSDVLLQLTSGADLC